MTERGPIEFAGELRTSKIENTRRILRGATTATLRECLAGYERLAVEYPGEPVQRLLAVVRDELATRTR